VPEQVLRVPFSETDDLDPARGDGSLTLLVQGLTALDEHLATVPGLASTWDISNEGTHVTFHLRDATYSSGVPITAADFVAAWRRALDPRIGPTFGLLLNDVVGAEALLTLDPEALPPDVEIDRLLDGLGVVATDPQTLDVDLARPASYFPTVVTNPVTAPLPPDWIDRPGATEGGAFVSSGPFVLAEWVHGQRRVFEPNPNWWGDPPQLDRIEMTTFASPEAELEAFREGRLDVLGLIGEAEEDDADLALPRPDNALTTISFMLRRSGSALLASPHLREALSLAVDRDQINAVAGFTGLVATSPIPPGIQGHDPTLEATYDPDAARAAVEQALPELGVSTPGEVHLSFLHGTRFGEAPLYLEATWEEILGIEVDRLPLEPAAYLERVVRDTDFDLFITTWLPDIPHPSNFLDGIWGCDGVSNIGGYCNPAVDDLFGEAAREADTDRQLAIYQEAQRLIVDDDASIFVQWPGGTALIASRVEGLVLTAMDDFPGSVMVTNVRIGPE
jgi:oligopeptide transport system substrate-binding protein